MSITIEHVRQIQQASADHNHIITIALPQYVVSDKQGRTHTQTDEPHYALAVALNITGTILKRNHYKRPQVA